MKRAMLSMLLLLVAMTTGAEEKKSTAGPGVQPLSAPMAMPGLGRERGIRVYLPPGYATSTRRYPVLYMHDAQNLFDDATSFMGEWGVDEALDRLAREKGLELIVVGIDNDGEQRIHELKPWPDPKYGAGEADAYLRFVVEVVKPWVDTHYRTRKKRADTGIMGSSLGGLTSWYAAFAYPRVFGRIGVFSPSYWIAPQAYEFARSKPLPRNTRMYQSIGDHEGGDNEHEETVAAAVRMETALRDAHPKLKLRSVVRAGAEHNERAWREEFPAAVLYLFGDD